MDDNNVIMSVFLLEVAPDYSVIVWKVQINDQMLTLGSGGRAWWDQRGSSQYQILSFGTEKKLDKTKTNTTQGSPR